MTRSATAPRAIPDGFVPGSTTHRSPTEDMSARFAPTSYDSRARTVEAVLSAGSPVRRWGIVEELAISPEAVDLRRVTAGQVRLLDHHNAYSRDAVLGVLESARFENGLLMGRIRLADTEQGRAAEGQITRGELTGISVGYRVTSWQLRGVENDQEIWLAARWELLEVSLVSVPADPAASIRMTGGDHDNRAERPQLEADDMRRSLENQGGAAPNDAPETVTRAATPPAPPPASQPAPAPVPAARADSPVVDADRVRAEERQRVADIMDLGTRAGMDPSDIRTAINGGQSVEAFRAVAFERVVGRSTAARTPIDVQRDEGDTRRSAIQSAIECRMAAANGGRPEVPGPACEYMRLTLAEMAALHIGQRSMPRSVAEREEVFQRAFHSTSDFPIIFGAAIQSRLLAAYTAAQPVYRQIARQTTFADFRPHEQIRVGDFPMLKAIGQGGEIKSGTFGEKKESITVGSYGVRVDLTRQMLVNDNLGAIDQVLAGQGTTVALFEEITFFSMKGTTGPTLTETGNAVYHSSHNNLAASGAAITTDSLAAGRAAMRKQKRLDNNPMNIAPSIILVSPDKETEAEKVLTTIVPGTVADVNIFSGRLRPVVSAMLSGNAWELHADTSLGSNFAWGLLDGYTAPRVRMEERFGVQGVGFSLEHDFGCGATDYRFGYRNPGP